MPPQQLHPQAIELARQVGRLLRAYTPDAAVADVMTAVAQGFLETNPDNHVSLLLPISGTASANDGSVFDGDRPFDVTAPSAIKLTIDAQSVDLQCRPTNIPEPSPFVPMTPWVSVKLEAQPGSTRGRLVVEMSDRLGQQLGRQVLEA